ncbi:MAG: ThiF family adenylyltransferase [Pirellulales bacterium]
MDDDRLIEHILVLGSRHAPSPDNNQPWRFKVDGRTINVYYPHDSTFHHSDPDGLLNYFSLGCLLECLEIAAKYHGFSVSCSDLPQSRPATSSVSTIESPRLVTTLTFQPAPPPPYDPLYHVLFTRSTDRRPYRRMPIDASILGEFSDLVQAKERVLHFVSDPIELSRLSDAITNLEVARFGCRETHRDLFTGLQLTRCRRQSHTGIPISSLALPVGTSFALRALSTWPLASSLVKTPLSGIMKFPIGRTYSASGAIGFLFQRGNGIHEFFNSGRCFLRMWLHAERYGLSCQPLAAVPIFQRLLRDGLLNTELLHSCQRSIDAIQHLCSGRDPSLIATAFRLGYPTKVKKRPLRIRAPLKSLLIAEHQQRESAPHQWSYERAFSRNRGIGPVESQERLRHATVAVPGMGGVGGRHLITLARMGIGGFHIADGDTFEIANFNRQYGATIMAVGHSKVHVMAKEALAINPELRLRCCSEPIDEHNIVDFLQGCNAVVDSLDAFNIDARILIYRTARQMKIPVIAAGPLGFGCGLTFYDPDGMSFEEYYDLTPEHDKIEKLARFFIGTAPHLKFLSYYDRNIVSIRNNTGPSIASAMDLCASLAATEVWKVLVGYGRTYPVPWHRYYDPYLNRFKRTWLPFGNRGILQRVKIYYLRRTMQRQEHR